MLTSDAGATSAAREKRKRLLRIIRGPKETQPFARERRQINVAIKAKEVALRLKQVVSLDVRRIMPGERTFKPVIRPIFQIMRFFLVKLDSFVHIFRGKQRLDLTRFKAVAVTDRLGGYMFSDHPRHLPKTVLRPLGTFDSLWAGGWPFLDPAVVNLGASGSGGATSRPVLLHVRELHHHYGARVASPRESAVWLAQLGAAAFTSKAAVAAFAEELLRVLWVLQMKAFIIQQRRRRLPKGGSDPSRPILMEDIAAREEAMAVCLQPAHAAGLCLGTATGY
ncbi:hypothetical protein ColTof4_13811 [Colletotrichum tofieldiae]|nr:hypothetical protein ColTof3_01737 [Colletotrichum tofieldiae]GKT81388.1 hypothetical protein ColTof4_13811 [Colletotrichum tofieldiae]